MYKNHTSCHVVSVTLRTMRAISLCPGHESHFAGVGQPIPVLIHSNIATILRSITAPPAKSLATDIMSVWHPSAAHACLMNAHAEGPTERCDALRRPQTRLMANRPQCLNKSRADTRPLRAVRASISSWPVGAGVATCLHPLSHVR